MIDPLFDPLLEYGAFWTILILSVILSVIITLVYKWLTNQEEMRDLKKQTKEYQKEMKKLKDDPKKMMKVQKEAMQVNSKYMMKSMKPTLVTFIPVLIIFGWLSSNLAYEPINVNDPFTIAIEYDEMIADNYSLQVPDQIEIIDTKEVDNAVTYTLKASEKGIYSLSFRSGSSTYTHKVQISDKIGNYVEPEKDINEDVDKITTEMTTIRPLGSFSIFGLQPNWLWTYIIFSMIISISLRKALKLS